MIQLSREIRFALTPNPDQGFSEEGKNSWAGWPATESVVPQLKLSAVIEGEPDPATGYLCNITVVDQLLRSILINQVIPNGTSVPNAVELLNQFYVGWVGGWKHDSSLVSLTLRLSPYLYYTLFPGAAMTKTRINLTQQFEFSAAHRLHCDHLTDEENLAMFGKCNNPEGHGHNYVVEVTIERVNEGASGGPFSLHQFESLVKEVVINRLDHKHLNKDVAYFSEVNPSVENIATAIFGWLNERLDNVKLESVKVFETPKTWAECRA